VTAVLEQDTVTALHQPWCGRTPPPPSPPKHHRPSLLLFLHGHGAAAISTQQVYTRVAQQDCADSDSSPIRPRRVQMQPCSQLTRAMMHHQLRVQELQLGRCLGTIALINSFIAAMDSP